MTKVKVSSLHDRKYSHAYRFTNSTTADFGFPQPLCCRLMYPKGSIKGSLKQFVRLSAMPRPTFGDVVMHNIACVVPIEDVFPAFMSMMKEQPYTNANGSRYIPKSMPSTTNSQLWSAVFQNYIESTSNGYVFKIPVGRSQDTSIDIMPFADYLSSFKEFYINKQYADIKVCVNEETEDYLNVYNGYCDYIINALNNGTIDYTTAEQLYLRDACAASNLDFVSGRQSRAAFDDYQTKQASFDYQVFTNTGSMSSSEVVGYRLTSKGKALRKIFLGLGYNISRDDNTPVNLLPLLAYYKAWYDRFVPYRDIPFSSSIGYTFIRYIEENPNIITYKYNSTASSGTADYFFTHFITDGLCNTYATQDINFLSLHTRSLANSGPYQQNAAINDEQFFGSPSLLDQPNATIPGEGSNSTEELTFPSSHDRTGLADTLPIASSPISGLTLKLLQRMYAYVGRDSLIGNRIELWAKSHLNSDVYNNVFKKVSISSSNTLHIQIGDIDATAGTRTYNENSVAQGNVLGDYAGKGIGTGELTFNAKSGTYAYFIVLSWVDVNTSVYQGTDAQLFALTKYEVPQAEFDALGYEITPRSVVWCDNDLSIKDVSAQIGNMPKSINVDSGFGYVPRYSGFKYAKNIVNGDMSLRSLRNSMNCYYADREILCRSLSFESTGGSSAEPRRVSVVVNDIPQASTAWRYVERYPWLSSYDRIFVNSAGMVLPFDKVNPFNPYTQRVHDDNFYVHCVFDITENTPLRPLSESFDTQILNSDEHTTISPA